MSVATIKGVGFEKEYDVNLLDTANLYNLIAQYATDAGFDVEHVTVTYLPKGMDNSPAISIMPKWEPEIPTDRPKYGVIYVAATNKLSFVVWDGISLPAAVADIDQPLHYNTIVEYFPNLANPEKLRFRFYLDGYLGICWYTSSTFNITDQKYETTYGGIATSIERVIGDTTADNVCRYGFAEYWSGWYFPWVFIQSSTAPYTDFEKWTDRWASLSSTSSMGYSGRLSNPNILKQLLPMTTNPESSLNKPMVGGRILHLYSGAGDWLPGEIIGRFMSIESEYPGQWYATRLALAPCWFVPIPVNGLTILP